ncbi:MAG: MBL fold metallo-hydrolase [Spirochaetia bacterium]|nr:MBL fold metallo-hydrolase [Spirochaetia bacterium]
MKIRIYGARGAIPAPGEKTQKYGGNTSCVLVSYEENQKKIIIDAGSGIRVLGENLIKEENLDIHIFLTHFHSDHIMGLPFFLPFYQKSAQITIYGPNPVDNSMEKFVKSYIENHEIAARLGNIQAALIFRELNEETFSLESLKVKTQRVNHPVKCIGYRFELNEKSVTFTIDHETYFDGINAEGKAVKESEKLNAKHIEFIRNSDILLSDAQYLPDEYRQYMGWGHSSILDAINRAIAANVRILVLFHHDPNREDKQIDKIVTHYRRVIERKKLPIKIYAAREGWEYLC